MTGRSAFLAQPAQQLHPVHSRHLDVEHGEVGRVVDQRLQRRLAVRIDAGQRSPPPAARSRPRSGCCGRRRPARSLPIIGPALTGAEMTALGQPKPGGGFDGARALHYAGANPTGRPPRPPFHRGNGSLEKIREQSRAVLRPGRQGIDHPRRNPLESRHPAAGRGGRAPWRRAARQRRPAGRRDRQAHRPLGQGQIHRPRCRNREHDLVGQ